MPNLEIIILSFQSFINKYISKDKISAKGVNMSVIKASYNRSVSFNPTSSTCQVIRGDSVVKVTE